MEAVSRYDIFEPEDLTALVCIDYHEVQKMVIDQLAALDYKIHTGLFLEDISLKLQTHTYDVVVIDEAFNDTDIECNGVLNACKRLPITQRRGQFIVLIGPSLITNNSTQAFHYSVDLVCSLSDLKNLTPVLRRGVSRNREFYKNFIELLNMTNT